MAFQTLSEAVEAGSILVSTGSAQTNPNSDSSVQAEKVPKMSLRRDSVSGSEWRTVQRQQKNVESRSTIAGSKRMIAENAVTGMFNAIKATFMQAPPSLEVPPTLTTNGGVNLPVNAPINVTNEAISRSSSASRGRGIMKKIKD